MPEEKLKALYTLIKQLFIGGAAAVNAVRGWEKLPQQLAALLGELSTIPEWIEHLKLSACRKGVMCAMTLSKVYHPEMDPALLAGGYPQFKTDNTCFTSKDFQTVFKQTRQYASAIARGIDLKSFQIEYDDQNQQMDVPKPQPFALISKNKGLFPLQKPASMTPSGSATPTMPAPPQATQGEDDDEMLMEPLYKIFRPGNEDSASGARGGVCGGDEAG